MSLEKAEEYLKNKGMLDHVIRLEDSTATVVEAAQALGVEPGMIAKTMSFLRDDQPVLILTEGTARIDNRKYKDTFHVKAKMIPFDEVESQIGHAPGGVCPFGINEGVNVYLDESLRQFDIVYPAAGDDHSAVKLSIEELEQIVEMSQVIGNNKYAPISEHRFHTKLYEITGNRIISEFQDIIYPVLDFVKEKYRDFFEPIEQELIQNSELVTHRHLLEYIKRGDLEGYKHAIVEHFKLYTIYLERHKR